MVSDSLSPQHSAGRPDPELQERRERISRIRKRYDATTMLSIAARGNTSEERAGGTEEGGEG